MGESGKVPMGCASDTCEGEKEGRRIRLPCMVKRFQPGQWKFSSQKLLLKESRVSQEQTWISTPAILCQWKRTAHGELRRCKRPAIMLPTSGDWEALFLWPPH